MINGVLNINGTAVQMEELGTEQGQFGTVTRYRETLPNGVTHEILDSIRNGSADNTDVFVVPEGHYFMMGDNRDNSQDSRFADAVGMVPEENLIGPIAFRIWNSEGVPLDNRPEETTAGP